jgi:hypothetical protein
MRMVHMAGPRHKRKPRRTSTTPCDTDTEIDVAQLAQHLREFRERASLPRVSPKRVAPQAPEPDNRRWADIVEESHPETPVFLEPELDARLAISNRFTRVVRKTIYSTQTDQMQIDFDGEWLTSTAGPSPTEAIHTDASLGNVDRPIGDVVYFAPDISHLLADQRLRDLDMLPNTKSVTWHAKIKLAPSDLLILTDADAVETHVFNVPAFARVNTEPMTRIRGHRLNWNAIAARYKAILFVGPIVGNRTTTPAGDASAFLASFAPNTLAVLDRGIIQTPRRADKLTTHTIRKVDHDLFDFFTGPLQLRYALYGAVVKFPDPLELVGPVTIPRLWYGPEFALARRCDHQEPAFAILDGDENKNARPLMHATEKGLEDDLGLYRKARTHIESNNTANLNGNGTVSVGAFDFAVGGINRVFILDNQRFSTEARLNTRDLRITAGNAMLHADRFAVQIPVQTDRPLAYAMEPFLAHSVGGADLRKLNDTQRQTQVGFNQSTVCELSFSGSGMLSRIDPLSEQGLLAWSSAGA